jgi:putative DNA primase/helicase
MQSTKKPEGIRNKLRKPYKDRPPILTGNVLMDALVYAGMGWKVFPVDRNKRPLIKDWPNAATSDPDQIRAWFTRFARANIGVATGRRSDLFVVDIDKRDAGGPEEWEGLLYHYGETVTMTSRTGGGGFHLFFTAPPCELGNSAGKLALGIDTRGDGGYVVVPPSVHESGDRYEWKLWIKPRHLPNWIAEALQNRSSRKAAPFATDPVWIEEGLRNTTLASFAGALRNVGADQGAIEAALLSINETSVSPPLADREVRQIAKSISRYQPGAMIETAGSEEKREWVEYSGLDLATLPEPEVKWVLPPIAAKGTVTMLAGQWKTAGKTTLLISGMYQVLTGGAFLGEPVRQSPVVYLYEGPADEFNHNDFAYQLYHEDFHLIPQDENAGRGWAEAIEHATARCLDLGAELMVIDTKTAWLTQSNDEENNSGFARQAMNMFAEAKLNGIAIIVAAHPTKNETGALSTMIAGSGQWAASAGRQFGIWVHEDANDPRRQIEAHGRQGCRNNLPRTIIEWDKNTNTYEKLGRADDVAAEKQDEQNATELGELLAHFQDGSKMEEIEQFSKDACGFSRGKARKLVELGVEREKLRKHLGEPPPRGPTPSVYSRIDN